MAEIFGAVAAGIAICHEMTRLAKKIHKVAKNVKNAPKDIGTLTDETVIFTGLYGDFLEMYEKGSAVDKSNWIESLKVCAENVIRRLRKILYEGDALRLDANYRYSLKDTWKANWNWLIRRNVVTHLRTSLAIASQTISGFLNMSCIRRLDEELSLLHSILDNPEQRSKIEAKFGVSLEEKIRCIQDKMGIRRVVHEKNANLLREAQNRATESKDRMDPEDALIAGTACGFANFLEVYAEEELPPRGSSSRSHTSAFSDVPSGSRQDFRDVHASNTSSPVASDSSVSGHFPIQADANRYESSTKTIYTNHSRGPTSGANPHTARQIPHTNDEPGFTFETAKFSARTSSNPIRIEIPVRRKNIGRHTIVLSSKNFRFNNYIAPIATDSNQRVSYELANYFFDDLLKHRDKLGELDVALNTQDPRSEWFGIPGWKVHSGRIWLQWSHPKILDT